MLHRAAAASAVGRKQVFYGSLLRHKLWSTFFVTSCYVAAPLALTSCSSSSDSQKSSATSRQAADETELKVLSEKLMIGSFESRAILKRMADLSIAQPLVVMLPGSGPQGPEEAIPSSLTTNSKDALLFNEFARALNQAGFATLQLGKPGVEFFSTDPKERFYDSEMTKTLRWADLIENAKEAIRWARRQPWVDSEKIILLGHSEGTQVAVDIARLGEKLQALILLGYHGHSIAKTIEFQVFDREVLWFLNRDLDENRDGKVSRQEAAKWKEFSWNWAEGQVEVSAGEIEQSIRSNEAKKKFVQDFLSNSFYAAPFDTGRDYFDSTASLSMPILVFNGEYDVQTPASEAKILEQKCEAFKKPNCFIHIIPGVGHGFSKPRGPRAHPLFDLTLGPPEESFLTKLRDFSAALR